MPKSKVRKPKTSKTSARKSTRAAPIARTFYEPQTPTDWLLHTETDTSLITELPFYHWATISTYNHPYLFIGHDVFTALSASRHQSPHIPSTTPPLLARTPEYELPIHPICLEVSLAALYHSTPLGSSSAPPGTWDLQTALFHNQPLHQDPQTRCQSPPPEGGGLELKWTEPY